MGRMRIMRIIGNSKSTPLIGDRLYRAIEDVCVVYLGETLIGLLKGTNHGYSCDRPVSLTNPHQHSKVICYTITGLEVRRTEWQPVFMKPIFMVG